MNCQIFRCRKLRFAGRSVGPRADARRPSGVAIPLFVLAVLLIDRGANGIAAIAGESASVARPAAAEERRVAATVDGVPVYGDQVDRELALVLKGRKIDPQSRQELQAKTLQQLIDRELILGWLKSEGQAASDQDIDLSIQRLKRELTQRGQKWEDYLRSRGIGEEDLRRLKRWQLSWSRFLRSRITDENLQKYFDQHRREFDGTRLRVAHILWKVEPPFDRSDLEKALAQARAVRDEIVSGRSAFADAARKYSKAPSASAGGDIGFISRKEPMPEAFSRAAFELDAGQVSEPTQTASGVHLIYCLEVEQGKKTWSEARSELEEAAAVFLFGWAADRRRGVASVRVIDDSVPGR
jgi:parvulin-like peptidyl-prolyl isomerase